MRELQHEAEIAKSRLQAQLAQEPGILLDMLNRPAVAPEISQVFEKSGYGHRLLRYELYDARGNLTFTSGKSGLDLGERIAETMGPKIPPQAGVGVRSGSGGSLPTHFAVLTLPISLNGEPRGTLVAYLDQSEQATMLSDYFGWIAAVTMMLLGIMIALPAIFSWMRGNERRKAQAQLRFLERHDALTDLPNRKAFNEGLADALARMQHDSTHIAVLCLDVDRFKEINDAVDIAGGDAVLREIASRLRHALREGDLIARLAGDEFAMALVDVTNLGDVMAFMNRLIEALRHPFRAGDKELVCTTSVGIALAPGDGDTAPIVLRHAAIALARAKSDGGQRMCFFEQSMDKALQRRRLVEHELRLALSRDEFDVVYQPEFDLTTGAQCAAEALIRWHHPVHGKIAPTHFISVAEDTGLIVPLGEWVLRRACSDAVTWPAPLTVAVNLSPAQFRDGDIAETVADILQETDLPAHRLELEITESLLINDTEEVLDKLNRLRKLGVSIAMDDFGTGYSSLSYLARFPFNKIKIDRSFIRNMTQDSVVEAIVKTIITLGRSLGVTITAEGVETEEQARRLREYGCPQVQGFLYGYPAPMDFSNIAPSKLKVVNNESSAA
ncbi:MAG TPA: bifunctional diguanylate cyclase/phosphodiesterase [Methyloceanibacter sp.]